jgi:hypothetical protein
MQNPNPLIKDKEDEGSDKEEYEGSDKEEDEEEKSVIEESDTESIKDFSDSSSQASNTLEEISYINEKHGLTPNLSEYTNDYEGKELQVYLCVFYSDKTIPETPFVKYIMKITEQSVSFPLFKFDLSVDGNSKIENEVDISLENRFQEECTKRVNECFISHPPPKYNYKGYTRNAEGHIFAFFEIEGTPQLSEGHLFSVLNELFFTFKVAEYAVSDDVRNFFEQNEKLLYYYDENDEKMIVPHSGYKVDDMSLFGEGTYFEIQGTGPRFAFFAETSLYLLNDEMIEAYKTEDEMVACEYDSIFFRRGGKDYWFIEEDKNIVPI